MQNNAVLPKVNFEKYFLKRLLHPGEKKTLLEVNQLETLYFDCDSSLVREPKCLTIF